MTADEAARTSYSNDVVLAQEIDALRAAYGQRIAELERQYKLLNNLLIASRRQPPVPAAEPIMPCPETTQSRLREPSCGSCNSL
jgi:hypothetical protein